MGEIASAYVAIIPSFQGFGTALNSQMGPQIAAASRKAGQTAASAAVSGFGNTYTSGVSARAAAAGASAGDAFTRGYSASTSSGLAVELHAQEGFFAATFDMAIKNVAIYGSMYKAIQLVSGGIDSIFSGMVGFNAQLEQADVGFTTLLGSSAAADAEMSWIRNFSKETPFNYQDLVKYDENLVAVGFTANEAHDALQAAGDAAAGLGQGADAIQRITLALEQMTTKGKIQSQELLQLSEVGINGLQILATKLGTTTGKAQQMVTDGVLDSATYVPVIIAGIESKFHGLMANESKTLTGTWENIGDTINQDLADAGKPLFEGLKGQSTELLNALSGPGVKSAINGVGDVLEKADAALGDLLKLAAGSGPELAVFATGALLVSKLSGAFTASKNAAQAYFTTLRGGGAMAPMSWAGQSTGFLGLGNLTDQTAKVKAVQLAENNAAVATKAFSQTLAQASATAEAAGSEMVFTTKAANELTVASAALADAEREVARQQAIINAQKNPMSAVQEKEIAAAVANVSVKQQQLNAAMAEYRTTAFGAVQSNEELAASIRGLYADQAAAIEALAAANAAAAEAGVGARALPGATSVDPERLAAAKAQMQAEVQLSKANEQLAASNLTVSETGMTVAAVEREVAAAVEANTAILAADAVATGALADAQLAQANAAAIAGTATASGASRLKVLSNQMAQMASQAALVAGLYAVTAGIQSITNAESKAKPATAGFLETIGGATAAGAGLGFMFGGPVGAGIGAAVGAAGGLAAALWEDQKAANAANHDMSAYVATLEKAGVSADTAAAAFSKITHTDLANLSKFGITEQDIQSVATGAMSVADLQQKIETATKSINEQKQAIDANTEAHTRNQTVGRGAAEAVVRAAQQSKKPLDDEAASAADVEASLAALRAAATEAAQAQYTSAIQSASQAGGFSKASAAAYQALIRTNSLTAAYAKNTLEGEAVAGVAGYVTSAITGIPLNTKIGFNVDVENAINNLQKLLTAYDAVMAATTVPGVLGGVSPLSPEGLKNAQTVQKTATAEAALRAALESAATAQSASTTATKKASSATNTLADNYQSLLDIISGLPKESPLAKWSVNTPGVLSATGDWKNYEKAVSDAAKEQQKIITDEAKLAKIRNDAKAAGGKLSDAELAAAKKLEKQIDSLNTAYGNNADKAKTAVTAVQQVVATLQSNLVELKSQLASDLDVTLTTKVVEPDLSSFISQTPAQMATSASSDAATLSKDNKAQADAITGQSKAYKKLQGDMQSVESLQTRLAAAKKSGNVAQVDALNKQYAALQKTVTADEAAFESWQKKVSATGDTAQSAAEAFTSAFGDVTDEISSLSDELTQFASTVAKAFNPDDWGEQGSRDFFNNLIPQSSVDDFIAQMKGNASTLSNVKAAYDTLLGEGIPKDFLTGLMTSGNASLLLDLASDQGKAQQAANLWEQNQATATGLGDFVASTADQNAAILTNLEGILAQISTVAAASDPTLAKDIAAAVGGVINRAFQVTH